MKVISDLSHFKKSKHPNLVVALGNFDGLHLGHEKILDTIRRRATELGGTSAVFTFREHPQRILHQKDDPPILTALIHKLHLLNQSGVDLCFLMEFSLPFSKKSPEQFVSEILIDRLGAKEVCMGFNARFGHGRKGDSQLMTRLAGQHGFTFVEAPPVRIQDRAVSSSLIRTLVGEGKLEEAGALLGRPYSFFGTLVAGSGRGKDLGFPTANLDPHSEVLPPEGVYAAWIRILNCRLVDLEPGIAELDECVVGDHLKALLNYGRRPTFGGDERPIPEIHILDEHEDLSNATVEVTVGKHLRAERRFPNVEALQSQIRDDIKQGEDWFAKQVV